MKSNCALMLIIALANSGFAQDLSLRGMDDEYQRGKLEGERWANDNYNSEGWFAAGLGGGLLLGPIGAGIAIGVSQKGEVYASPDVLENTIDKSNEFRMGFIHGYENRANSKKLNQSILGGVIGTVVAVLIVVKLTE